jgi:hypothetical protein
MIPTGGFIVVIVNVVVNEEVIGVFQLFNGIAIDCSLRQYFREVRFDAF